MHHSREHPAKTARVRTPATQAEAPTAGAPRAPHRSHVAAILALQRRAGNAAVSRMLQRSSQWGGWKWSGTGARTQSHFATNGGPELGIADAVAKPDLPTAQWTSTNTVAKWGSTNGLPLYRLTWEADDSDVHLPQDCVMTAELVTAWQGRADARRLEDVNTLERGDTRVPSVTPVAREPVVGDILLHVHSKEEGEHHGAAVIAEHQGDVVTMEADSSEVEYTAAPPLFDMYTGRAGFRSSQGDVPGEYTYVIPLSSRLKDAPKDALADALKDLWGDKQFNEHGREAIATIMNVLAPGFLDDDAMDEGS
jgi:hypothetical protein